MRSEMSETVAVPIRIIAADELELSRAGLCLLLSQQKGFEVIGSFANWPEALAMVQREQPDIILLSISAENSIGLKFLPEFMAVSGSSKILVLSDSDDQELFRKAVRLGAAGVLSKNNSAATLVKAVECLNAGEAWLDRSITATLLQELSPRSPAAKKDPEQIRIASLTEREREVVRMVGKGFKNRQIAEKLFISDVTVHHHLTSIYSKLEVADRMELLIFAYRKGLAEISF
jgi:two-component system nitrate/nitrite response regulator NarL